MLCEKSKKELQREADKWKDKHRSQPNLPTSSVYIIDGANSAERLGRMDLHALHGGGGDAKTKSTPARLGMPAASTSSPNVMYEDERDFKAAGRDGKESRTSTARRQKLKNEPVSGTRESANKDSKVRLNHNRRMV
jgi:hypothetical protein